MTLTTDRQRIEWMGLRLSVPPDWQVVRHGIDPEKGRLVLVDRRRQRLQLVWTRLDAAPDLEHMLDDHRARELEHDASAEFSPMPDTPGWVGLRRELDAGGAMVRAARYDAPTRRLLEAVLTCDVNDTDDAALTRGVLGDIKAVCDPADARRFCLFDLDVAAPPHWRLSKTQVQPADVTFRFTEHDGDPPRPTRNEAAIRRRGMADVWDAGDHEKLLRRQEPDAAFEFGPAQYHGAPATMGLSLEPGKRYARLMGKLRDRRDLVWSSPAENAVYQITTLSKSGRPVEPTAFEVSFIRRSR